jgi:hypothetical protein
LRGGREEKPKSASPSTCRKLDSRGATGANVVLAASVYQQDELRGANKDIRSFAAITKSRPRRALTTTAALA